ncbi:MAG: YggS family pyridoxal phosphate-dependent enzyme [Rhodocyclaceae bacterium]|nr:YggS family pyridoxal phosphate-dependent enzyme [Rhodocyclaceae bacterium]
MTPICANLQAVRGRIAAACAACGRDPGGVTLLAVSKTWPADRLREAAAAGQPAFGENYVQEAVAKMDALLDLSLEWHFIGPLQSNKTRAVAERFAWVHSVERLKTAERLSAQRPAILPPLQVCLQVNVSGEASKSGCAPDDAVDLARAVAALPGLRLRGLMAIPEPTDDRALLRSRFALLRGLRDGIAGRGLNLDTLSMGMSDDLEIAIAEGATLVRVGTAIFGERPRGATPP